MFNLNYTYTPLLSQNKYQVSLNNNVLVLEDNNSTTHIKLNAEHSYCFDIHQESTSIFLEVIFGLYPHLDRVRVNDQERVRSDFYQSAFLWLRKKTALDHTSFPERPNHFHGVHYQRFIPSLNKTIRFRTITPQDINVFHEWHNQKRVSFYWELNKTKDELLDYIHEGLQKKHQIPMIVEFDGEPVGYYEFYWVKEDRLGPYYEARPYDRGFHFLIGNKRFLGKTNTDAITQSGLHFIYLDDARTEYVMAEPRYDNSKVLRYADNTIGWDALKVFDFPHKKAVLLQNTRDRFFKGAKL